MVPPMVALKNVLVVEDNAVTRRMVRTALEAEGIAVSEASDGKAALRAARGTLPDLVLLDLVLGDCDGIALLAELREVSPTMPVIAFTGRCDEEQIRAAGFTDVLTKPVESRRLVGAIKTHLASAATIALPRTNTRERAWTAMTQILTGLTDLAGQQASIERTVRGVLESLLDASGFEYGCAWSMHAGRLAPSASVGFAELDVARILEVLERDPAFAQAVGSRTPVGVSGPLVPLETSRLASAILIPLHHGDELFGMIALGSGSALSSEWLGLLRLISGPIMQSLTLANTVARLSASEHKFRGIADTTRDGIVLTGTTGAIKYVNASAERLIGTTAVGRPIDSVIPFLATGATTGNLYKPGGEDVPIDSSVRSFEDPPGVLNRVYVLRDLSQHARIDELAHLANHDVLTGICNRRRFEEELETRLATSRRHLTPGALVMVDLDQFKPINDRHGHPAGDRVLQAVAAVLTAQSRQSDLVARLGGDEFVMLLDHTDAEGAIICAERTLAAIRAIAIRYGDHVLRIGASLGISIFPRDGFNRVALLATADAALYEAKRLGRNRVIDRHRVESQMTAASSIAGNRRRRDASTPPRLVRHRTRSARILSQRRSAFTRS